MAIPVSQIQAERLKVFVPDEIFLLVFAVSQFKVDGYSSAKEYYTRVQEKIEDGSFHSGGNPQSLKKPASSNADALFELTKLEYDDVLKDFQPLEDIPKSYKDGNMMLSFATDFLNVPLDNIVIMSS